MFNVGSPHQDFGWSNTDVRIMCMLNRLRFGVHLLNTSMSEHGPDLDIQKGRSRSRIYRKDSYAMSGKKHYCTLGPGVF